MLRLIAAEFNNVSQCLKRMIREQMLFTTVVQKLNQGTQPENGPFRFRGAFFGTFLAKQKSTKNSLVIL